MRIILLLLFTSFVTGNFKAQQNKTTQAKRDSLRMAFSRDSTNIFEPKRLTPYFALEFKNAYVGDRFLSFIGPQAGVIINYRHIVGFSYNFLNKFSPFQSDKLREYSFEKINYFSAFYQYIVYDSKQFDILFPFEIGYGKYKAKKESSGNYVQSEIIPFGLSARCVILPHKWIGLKLGVGYTFIYELNRQIGLDGMNFTLGIKIDLRQLYLDYQYHRLKRSHKRYLKSLK